MIVEGPGFGAWERSAEGKIAGKTLLQAAENFRGPGSRVTFPVAVMMTKGSLGS